MNTQEAFNLIWERAQSKVRASDEEGCLYRVNGKAEDLGNNACFVGVCIPPELYDPNIECESPYKWDEDNAPKLANYFKDCSLDFLKDCQKVHDYVPPEDWNDELISIAKDYQLKIPGEEND